jgi:hypothetical protein
MVGGTHNRTCQGSHGAFVPACHFVARGSGKQSETRRRGSAQSHSSLQRQPRLRLLALLPAGCGIAFHSMTATMTIHPIRRPLELRVVARTEKEARRRRRVAVCTSTCVYVRTMVRTNGTYHWYSSTYQWYTCTTNIITLSLKNNLKYKHSAGATGTLVGVLEYHGTLCTSTRVPMGIRNSTNWYTCTIYSYR